MHVETIRVALADTDAGGRIHWSAVFRWAELAEHGLLRSLGRTADEAGSYPRRAAEAIYHRPLSFDDEGEVQLEVAASGRTSVTFGWQVVKSGQLCVEGRHTVVHVDENGRPAAWPGYLRAGLDGTAAAAHSLRSRHRS
jgi:acyl-CoA thioester hydrolase